MVQALGDKFIDFLMLYPKTLENEYRAKQIKKYIVQILLSLARLPSFLGDKGMFGGVKYYFNEYLKIFGKLSSEMAKIDVLTEWLIFMCTKGHQIKETQIKEYLRRFIADRLDRARR